MAKNIVRDDRGDSIEVSVCTGTYNRLIHLQKMVESVRKSIGVGIPYEIVLTDGGSTDGTIEWCKAQGDVVLIEQGELLGAVKAFNSACRAARGRYVVLANDDIAFVDESILCALSFMDDNLDVGVGCFWQDRGDRDWHIEYMPARLDGQQVNHIYGQVCIVPKWLGDRVGWWGDYLHTYGGDNELSSNVMETGYEVAAVPCACIHDFRVEDELREINIAQYDSPAAAVAAGNPHGDTTRWGKKWARRGGKGFGPEIKYEPTIENPLTRKMRIFYAPIYERGHFIQKSSKRGLRRALGNVGMVWEYDYIDVAAEKGNKYCVDYTFDITRAFQPDILLFQIHAVNEYDAQSIAELKSELPDALFVNWNGDYHPGALSDGRYMDMLKQFDLTGLVATVVKDIYASAGIEWFYWQIGYEESNADPTKASPVHDVVFLANGYSRQRIRLAEILRSLPCNVGLYGSWGRIRANGSTLYDFDAGCSIYRAARIAVGDSQWPDATGFVSNRLFQSMAAGGALLLQQHFDGMEELLGLEDGKHLVVWNSVNDLKDKIQHWLDPANERKRKKIAKYGTDYVLRNHSFDVRVQELLVALKDVRRH